MARSHALLPAGWAACTPRADEPPLTPMPSRGCRAMTCLTVSDPERCRERRFRELPRYRLLDMLEERGWYRLGSLIHLDRSRVRENPFQELLLRVLVWGGGFREAVGWSGVEVFREEYCGRVFRYLAGRGGERADAVYTPSADWRMELLVRLPERTLPLIVLDLSLLHRHVSLSELSSLRRQVGAVLGVVRRFLWDRHLLVAGAPPGAYEWLRLFMGRALVDYSPLASDEAASLRGARRIILLDPGADRDLDARDVLEADAFILGGIVDRVPRPGETRRLRLQGLAEPRRLALRGSVHGVPSRLNSVAEIVLRARYETCGDVEEAIRRVMSPRDARLRAYVELSRWSRGRRRKVPWSLYEELASWLPLSPRDFVRATRMAGLEVEGEPPSICGPGPARRECRLSR